VNSANPVPCRPFTQANRNSPIALASAAALLVFALSAEVLGIAQQTPVNVATPVAAADASCGQCHASILRSYLATPMANASGLAVERLKTGAFEHRPSGVKYSLSFQESQLTLTYKDPNDPETAVSRKLEYFLGSGHLGLTYLYSLNGYLFESPVAYYAASQGLDMKPGLESMTEAPPALPVQAECLRCHMSGVQHSDSGTINRYSGLPFLHAGIICESCHGDTRQHLVTGGQAVVVNPSKLDARLRDSVCISCHLEGDISVERAGHSALDFKPGDPISDYLAYFVYIGEGATRRGVSEVEQLSLSRCKQTSGDAMSCMSCHDPHDTPGPGEQAAFYRKKCLACHTGAAFAAEHHAENPDCTSCHMKRTGAENIPHVAWTDHRILKYPEAPAPPNDTTASPTVAGETLVPVFSPGTTTRDLALAYYSGLLDGTFRLQQKVYEGLEAIKPELSGDKDALAALGILSEERGDYKQARELLQEVLKLDPDNLTAVSNLGTLLAKSGDLQGAISLWRPAFERNQDVAGLAKNLAQVECIAGDTAAARTTLQKTLQYNPGLRDVRQMLTRLPACTEQKH
jgi:predicted CXXCH cytochrome family protein